MLGEMQDHINDLNKIRTTNIQTGKPLKGSPTNPLYGQIREALYKLREKNKNIRNKLRSIKSIAQTFEKDHSKKELRINCKKIDHLSHRLRNTRSKDPKRIALRYIYSRYADDWIFIFNGGKKLAEQLKSKISNWLRDNLKMTLAMDKTTITDIRKEPAKFLGFEIKTTNSRKLYFVQNQSGKTRLRRIAGWQLYAYPDKQRLINRLHMKGYCQADGKPCEIPWLSGLEPQAIIEKYNSVLRGLVGYYAEFVYNKASLDRWIWIIRFSCIKTLAQKYSTNIAGVFKKLGTQSEDGTRTVGVTIQCHLPKKTYQKTWNLLTPRQVKLSSLSLQRRDDLKQNHLRIMRKDLPDYYAEKKTTRSSHK